MKLRTIIIPTLICSMMISSCSTTVQTTTDYVRYSCYDANLTYTKVGKTLGKNTIEFVDESGVTDEYNYVYRAISGESTEQFVAAAIGMIVLMPGGESSHQILQNPDHFVNVLEDWTVKEIQACRWYLGDQRYSRSHHKLPSDRNLEIRSVTSEQKIIDELDTFMTREDITVKKITNLNGYKLDKSSDEIFYLRIVFHESENIVWECEIRPYSNDSSRLFYLELCHIEGIDDVRFDFIKVPVDSELHNFLCEAFS